VQQFVLDHRTAAATTANRIITWLGSTAVLAPPVVVVGASFLVRRRDWRPGAVLFGALAGAILLYDALKLAVEPPRPAGCAMLVVRARRPARDGVLLDQRPDRGPPDAVRARSSD